MMIKKQQKYPLSTKNLFKFPNLLFDFPDFN